MKPFGCLLTILNNIDNLGKFEVKSDEGYLLGYCTNSKGFRVYNKTSRKVQDCLHVEFLEDQEKVKGKGPDWIFDLEIITPSMNYVPVRKENQAVHEEDQQFIVHEVPSTTSDEPLKDLEAEKDESTIKPNIVLSNAEQAFQDELNQLMLQENIAKAYTDP